MLQVPFDQIKTELRIASGQIKRLPALVDREREKVLTEVVERLTGVVNSIYTKLDYNDRRLYQSEFINGIDVNLILSDEVGMA